MTEKESAIEDALVALEWAMMECEIDDKYDLSENAQEYLRKAIRAVRRRYRKDLTSAAKKTIL